MKISGVNHSGCDFIDEISIAITISLINKKFHKCVRRGWSMLLKMGDAGEAGDLKVKHVFALELDTFGTPSPEGSAPRQVRFAAVPWLSCRS